MAMATKVPVKAQPSRPRRLASEGADQGAGGDHGRQPGAGVAVRGAEDPEQDDGEHRR